MNFQFIYRQVSTGWAIILFFITSSFYSCSNNEISAPPVLVNNAGYNLEAPKTAFVTDIDADSFSVVEQGSGKTVFSTEIQGISQLDLASGDYVRKINFTEVDKPGSFVIKLDNMDQVSHPFQLKDDPYSSAALAALRSFYFHRCGSSVLSGKWFHPACHIQKAVDYNNKEREVDTSGGWHDAGDYNKFAVTHNITIAYLLNQYLDNPGKYRDGQLDIPGSSNSVPDILDEVRWGLEWLLKMQKANGGIPHKVSIKKWTGEHLPHNENDQQFVFEVSSTGTAGAVAVFALGAQVYRDFDIEFSEKLEAGAIAGWEFLEENPVTIPLGGFVNPPDVSGGEYGDDRDRDERLYASVELYKLTGEPEYLEYFHLNYKDFWNSSFYVATWQDLRNFAYYSYLNLQTDKEGVDKKVHEELSGLLLEYVDKLATQIDENGYQYVLKKEEFYWGSNSVAMGYAFDFIQAYKLTDNPTYRRAALDQLHYILGRNPLGISFVTGVGSNSVSEPYHQFSKLDGIEEPIPGMLVGGANYYSHLNDRPISEFTAKNYEDRFENYKVNEPAINYTASLSYVVGYFSSFQKNKNRASNDY